MSYPACSVLAFLACAVGPLLAQAPRASQRAAAEPMKSWFVRLIPPRPHFDKDANEAELKVMGAHFVYWKELLDEGICVFGGPVLDPKGTFGVLAIWAASEEEARTLVEGDPAVKAGIMRFELAEMRIAYLAKGPGN